MNRKCLTLLNPGERGVVLYVSGDKSMRRRLQDLGIVEGTEILCLQRSPFGDPTAFSIRGAVIALREEDSFNILLK